MMVFMGFIWDLYGISSKKNDGSMGFLIGFHGISFKTVMEFMRIHGMNERFFVILEMEDGGLD